MKQSESRGNWYLLTGLLLGLGLGLLYAWVISPAQYIDTAPASLADSYKDEYRKAIALAYQADLDIGRARQRVLLVDPGNPAQAMAGQAQRMMAENLSPRDARALAELAAALGQISQSVAQNSATAPVSGGISDPSQTPGDSGGAPTATLDPALAIQTATPALPSPTPTATLTPAPTFTPRPTATPPNVQNTVFSLEDEQTVCTTEATPGLLKLMTLDSQNNAMANVQIHMLWNDQEEIFYTGLAPDISPGYADFQMQTGITYLLQVGETNEKIEVKIPSCGGELDMRFRQTRP